MSNIKPGFVYVLENPSFPGLVKIGMTTQNNVEKRVSQMSTGVPTLFTIAYKAQVSDPASIEKALHESFKEKRFSKGREWFSVSIEDVISLVWKLDDAVRYRDNMFEAIKEFMIKKEVLESRDKKIFYWSFFIVLSLLVIFYTVSRKENLFDVLIGLFFISIIPALILENVVVPLINRLRFFNEIKEIKVRIAKKYGVNPDDLKKYKEEFLNHMRIEARREYLRNRRLYRTK